MIFKGLPKIIFPLLILLILTGTLGSTYYFYMKYKESETKLQNPVAVSTEELKDVVGKVGQLVQLPFDEEPTLATVSDADKLRDTPFFSQAENGDKVLIYTRAKKAYLYRPARNIVIDMAPINIGDTNAEQVAGASTTTVPVVVTLSNGSGNNDFVAKTESILTNNKVSFEVKARTTSGKTYTETLVIDLTGSNGAKASNIANLLGGKVSSLPDQEIRPEGDILIIIGQNLK